MNKMDRLRLLSKEEIFSENPRWRIAGEIDYYAMYSSVFGGIVKTPELMVIPIDDHMAHRGDGIFEVFKCLNGNIYNLHAHLLRLQRSAEFIELSLPCDLETLKNYVIQTVTAGGTKDCSVRIFVSRGMGGFSCSPEECGKSHLYILSYSPWVPPRESFTEGVFAITTKVPVKPSFFAQVKSCNYLPNVMAYMEAEEKGADFAIFLDDRGYLAEAATQSIAIVSKERKLIYPSFDHILIGTTLARGVELARELVADGGLTGIIQGNITLQEAYLSSEILILSTGPNVLPVIKYDDKIIGNGKPGPVYGGLAELFKRDTTENKDMLTPCF